MDHQLAFQCFSRAAQMGNPMGQCNLGLCYILGIGCNPNLQLAFKWISLAIESENPIVIQMLMQSLGLDVDKASGVFRQFRQATSDVRFDKSFAKASGESKTPIMPIPPSE
jgi:TPR repeat protein